MNYIHTNFYNFFFKQKLVDKKKINLNKSLELMEKQLKMIGSKKIIIPTYNYDFVKKKIYNVNKDISQVGSFTEFFRKKYNQNRTNIPIYSSCSNFKNNNIIIKNNFIDIIGEHSDFNNLLQKNGNIINFEENFGPTFIIFIEKLNSKKIMYRYSKKINGLLIKDKIKKNISIDLFVRPRKLDISYNLSKIKKDLIKNKILKQEKIGIFNYEIYNSNEFFEFCSNRLDKDNLYFLDNKSKKLLKKKKINLRNKELIKKFD
jgi:aminoglycoside N3'-acetyltransferase